MVTILKARIEQSPVRGEGLLGGKQHEGFGVLMMLHLLTWIMMIQCLFTLYALFICMLYLMIFKETKEKVSLEVVQTETHD